MQCFSRLVFLILLLTVGCFKQEPEDIFKGKSLTYQQKGQHLFNRHCLSCHGPEGKGTGMTPFILYENEIVSDEVAFIKLLVQGREGTMMKSFKNRLSTEYMEYIRDYLLDLRMKHESK